MYMCICVSHVCHACVCASQCVSVSLYLSLLQCVCLRHVCVCVCGGVYVYVSVSVSASMSVCLSVCLSTCNLIVFVTGPAKQHQPFCALFFLSLIFVQLIDSHWLLLSLLLLKVRIIKEVRAMQGDKDLAIISQRLLGWVVAVNPFLFCLLRRSYRQVIKNFFSKYCICWKHFQAKKGKLRSSSLEPHET